MTDRHDLTVQQADALWDAIAIPGPREPTFTEQHERTCKTVARLLAERPMQDVQGRCPACGWTSLFLGDGGYVTCSRLECPNPSAADQLLHGDQPAAGPGFRIGSPARPASSVPTALRGPNWKARP